VPERAVFEREKAAREFYIEDHAVLYGLLVKSVRETLGERGVKVGEAATILYARERGLRMAMRCRADGRPLTHRNYMVYGEWADARGWCDSRMATIAPEYSTEVLTCGWCKSWEKHGLLEYGAVYCGLIDENLVKGFNPENDLEVDGTLSRGKPECVFHWKGCRFDSLDDLKADADLRSSLAFRTVRDFLYHTAHVLSAFTRVCYLESGLVRGDEIIEKALEDYKSKFGAEKTAVLVEESKQNFLLIEAMPTT
jgi:hypothetical protein